jgi:hypothetical protein
MTEVDEDNYWDNMTRRESISEIEKKFPEATKTELGYFEQRQKETWDKHEGEREQKRRK